MTTYRCGPRSDHFKLGCGGVFEHDDGPEGLFAPTHCPLCRATFCGEDCLQCDVGVDCWNYMPVSF